MSFQVPPGKNHPYLKCQFPSKIPIWPESFLYKYSEKCFNAPLPITQGVANYDGVTCLPIKVWSTNNINWYDMQERSTQQIVFTRNQYIHKDFWENTTIFSWRLISQCLTCDPLGWIKKALNLNFSTFCLCLYTLLNKIYSALSNGSNQFKINC